MASDDDSATSSDDLSEESTSWVSWFCSLRGNEFFCVVEEEYIGDGFNLSGLKEDVQHYEMAMETIVDAEQADNHNLNEVQQEEVDSAAELLYGLIHARFILTSKGLTLMNEKFLEGHFGQCTNYLCQSQNLLPVGLHDQPRKAYVYLYCPRCSGVFSPRSSRHTNIDGAYFGTTFPHLLLLTFPGSRPPPTKQTYVPKIFGFKVHTVGEGGGEGGSGAGGSGSSSSSAGSGGGGGKLSPRKTMTTVLDREGPITLVAPDGKRLEMYNEDFLDLEDLVAQQSAKSKGKRSGGNR